MAPPAEAETVNFKRFHLLHQGATVADGICYEDSWTFDFPDGLLLMAPGWCEVRWRDGCSTTGLWQSTDLLLQAHGFTSTTELVWEGE